MTNVGPVEIVDAELRGSRAQPELVRFEQGPDFTLYTLGDTSLLRRRVNRCLSEGRSFSVTELADQTWQLRVEAVLDRGGREPGARRRP